MTDMCRNILLPKSKQYTNIRIQQIAVQGVYLGAFPPVLKHPIDERKRFDAKIAISTTSIAE